SWRADPRSRREGLVHAQQAQLLRGETRDVLGRIDVPEVGSALTQLAEDVLEATIELADPQVPFAVIAMGRFGGTELAYASDLDVLLVFDPAGRPDGPASGLAAAGALLRLVKGETPALRLYTLDTDLRPEGRQGPLARSLGSYAAYYLRWAQPWERQALLRGRFAAGDPDVGARFAEVAERFIWERPFTEEDAREIRRTKARVERERIPAGEDPEFHLKLGRGSLSDVEWTAQLLQLRHGVRATATLAALDALGAGGFLDPDDHAALAEAYRFCELARNRLFLVRGVPGDSLPSTGPTLSALARSLATTPTDLREDYRRVTRRSRRVMERLFYGRSVG
ncbi:MAG: putative nucleotidyltransferase substrate binding domain-containing protein, partial [Acidimicrobiales bacterium]